jgi:hypothetical protein
MQAKATAAAVASSAARISWRPGTNGGERRASGRGEWTLAIDYSIAKINDGAPSSAINMGTPAYTAISFA